MGTGFSDKALPKVFDNKIISQSQQTFKSFQTFAILLLFQKQINSASKQQQKIFQNRCKTFINELQKLIEMNYHDYKNILKKQDNTRNILVNFRTIIEEGLLIWKENYTDSISKKFKYAFEFLVQTYKSESFKSFKFHMKQILQTLTYDGSFLEILVRINVSNSREYMFWIQTNQLLANLHIKTYIVKIFLPIQNYFKQLTLFQVRKVKLILPEAYLNQACAFIQKIRDENNKILQIVLTIPKKMKKSDLIKNLISYWSSDKIKTTIKQQISDTNPKNFIIIQVDLYNENSSIQQIDSDQTASSQGDQKH